MNKRCSKCGETKSLDAFSKDKSQRDGLQRCCKECNASYHSQNLVRIRQRKKAYREANKVAIRAQQTKWRENNYAQEKRRVDAWRSQNHTRVLERQRARRAARAEGLARYYARYQPAYKNAHRAEYSAHAARRRASKLQATPAWANDFFIQEIYALAQLRTKLTGVKHHVDHIVPLQSKLVCGLHVEYNLAVIPARDNLHKSNRSWPDMP